MKYTPVILQEVLCSLIRKLGETPKQYVRRPGRDFTRPRTLSFEAVISLLLTMSENSVGKVLMERFQNREDTPSASAFVQQREKLLPTAIEMLFQWFTACLRPAGRFQGYRLLAAGGSDLNSAAYPGDPASYRPGTERQHGWNLWHLNALYPKRFPPAALKRLYAMRWGIETSFRSLKSLLASSIFIRRSPTLSSRRSSPAFSSSTFTQASVWAIDTVQGASKYQCRVNFSDAVFACCAFLTEPISDPLPLLRRKLLPVRPGRTAPRPQITGNRISSCYASAR